LTFLTYLTGGRLPTEPPTLAPSRPAIRRSPIGFLSLTTVEPGPPPRFRRRNPSHGSTQPTTYRKESLTEALKFLQSALGSFGTRAATHHKIYLYLYCKLAIFYINAQSVVPTLSWIFPSLRRYTSLPW